MPGYMGKSIYLVSTPRGSCEGAVRGGIQVDPGGGIRNGPWARRCLLIELRLAGVILSQRETPKQRFRTDGRPAGQAARHTFGTRRPMLGATTLSFHWFFKQNWSKQTSMGAT